VDQPQEGSDVRVVVAEGVGTVELDRPPVNALRTGTYRELAAAFERLHGDDTCRVIVLRSAVPGVFSAGADIKELPLPRRVDEARQELVRHVFSLVMRGRQPVVAAVDGYALGGGCALVAAADIRVATRRASFGLPEITAGRCGGGRHLMRVLPQGAVRRAYFTGKPIPAPEAFRLGMVDELVDGTDALTAATDALASDIAAKDPTALRFAKEALDLAEEMTIEAGYHVEQQFTLRLALVRAAGADA
jgi:enoyl-CoA hydratase